ncbi:hypothetical protein C0995_001723, partial [Termitomyces sp. Mi166
GPEPAVSDGTSPNSSVIVTLLVARLVAGSCDTGTGPGGADGPDTVMAATTNNSTGAMLVTVGTGGSGP